jgi:hypothetical protein
LPPPVGREKFTMDPMTLLVIFGVILDEEIRAYR